MGLWNVVICIKIYDFKGSTKYDIDFNFAKVYRNGPPFYL